MNVACIGKNGEFLLNGRRVISDEKIDKYIHKYGMTEITNSSSINDLKEFAAIIVSRSYPATDYIKLKDSWKLNIVEMFYTKGNNVAKVYICEKIK